MSAIQQVTPKIGDFVTRLRQAKAVAGHTNQSLADASGLSISTVSKLLSGATEAPKLVDAAALALVLELSLDEVCGLIRPAQSEDELAARVHALELETAQKDAELVRLQTIVSYQAEQLKSKKASLLIMICLCTILTVALVAYIMIDSGIPDAGLIRFGDPTAAAWLFFALVALSAVLTAWAIVKYARAK